MQRSGRRGSLAADGGEEVAIGDKRNAGFRSRRAARLPAQIPAARSCRFLGRATNGKRQNSR